jgi:hypothetical protein
MASKVHVYKGYEIAPTVWQDSKGRWYLMSRRGDCLLDERISPQFATLADAKLHIDDLIRYDPSR